MCIFVHADARLELLVPIKHSWKQGETSLFTNYIQCVTDRSDGREKGQRELQACTTQHVILRNYPNRHSNLKSLLLTALLW